MWIDPVVEEVRANRRAIAAEAGNDIQEICRQSKAREAALGDRLLKLDTVRIASKFPESNKKHSQD